MQARRFLILIAILYVVFIGGTVYPTNNLVLRIFYHVATAGFVIIWSLVRLYRGTLWPRTHLDASLAAYIGWLGVSTLASHDVRVSLEQSYPFLLHIIWFYMIVDVIRNGHQRWLFEALFISSGVFVAISVLELASWYLGLGFAGYDIGWFAIGGFNNPIPPEGYKLALALNVSTLVGNWAVVVFILVVGWMWSTPRPDYRLSLGLLAGGLFLVLLGSGSRGAFLALITATGVLTAFWMLRRLKLRNHQVLGAAAIGIVAIVLFVVIFTYQSDSSSDQRRIDMWESAIVMVEDDLLTGAGVYQFGSEYRKIRDKSLIQDKIVSAHNLWLNTAAELGLPGLLILFWVGGSFGFVWWHQWQSASGVRRLRLESILAALIAFGIHSVIDTFTLSSSVLPILLATAYVMADQKWEQIQQSPRWIYGLVVLITGAFLLWFIRLDIAQVRHTFSIIYVADEEYEQALEKIDAAISLDSELGLYNLQRDYILGLLAQEDPGAYLEPAITSHLSSLQSEPTYDIGFANTAAIFAQAGDYLMATAYMSRAVDIRPDLWQYWVKLGEYQEASGQLVEARSTYYRALGIDVDMVRSDYWEPDDNYPARTAALEIFYQNASPSNQVMIAIYRDWPERAQAAAAIVIPDDFYDYFALGCYSFYVEDYDASIVYYTQAIDETPPDDQLARVYAKRAETNLELENLDDAEDDAYTALFLNKVDGARGYYVLAQLRMNDGEADSDTIDRYLIMSVKPRVVAQEYAVALYGRPAMLDWLPQLALPGQGLRAYEPWLLLMQRYENDGDPETNPADVVEAIHDSDPYLSLVPQ